MKYNLKTRESVSNFNFESNELKIEANAKAFDVVMGAIYTDIIKAFVRELITNGWDSHIAAKTENTPIDIFTPSESMSNFIVRDYGVGMDEQTVEDIYSVLFKSTKDSSNNEAGMFGIGSKTPLGYTSSFMVHCYDGNTERIYRVFKNDAGKPEIAKISEFENDEPTGVKISVPIESDDHDKLENEVKDFLRFFEAPYRLNTIFDEKDYTEDVYYEDDYILVYDKETPERFFVKMGPVLYPIPQSIVSDSAFYKFRTDYRHKRTIVFKANIGDFNVTSSRDGIKIDNNTKPRLVELYNQSVKLIFDGKFKNKKFKHYTDFFLEYKDFTTMFGEIPNDYCPEHFFKLKRANGVYHPRVTFSNGEMLRVLNSLTRYDLSGRTATKRTNSFINTNSTEYIIVTSKNDRTFNYIERLKLIRKEHHDQHNKTPIIIFVENTESNTFSLRKLAIVSRAKAIYNIADYKIKKDKDDTPAKPKVTDPKDLKVTVYNLRGKTYISNINDMRSTKPASEVDLWIREPIDGLKKSFFGDLSKVTGKHLVVGLIKKRNKVFSTLNKPIGISEYIKEAYDKNEIDTSLILSIMRYAGGADYWSIYLHFKMKHGIDYFSEKETGKHGITEVKDLQWYDRNMKYVSPTKLLTRYKRLYHPDILYYKEKYPELEKVSFCSEATQMVIDYVNMKEGKNEHSISSDD